MLHEQLFETLVSERSQDGFVFPDYGRRSLAEIVPTVEMMFGVKPERPILPRHMWERFDRHRRVILLVLDGFAFTHFAHFHQKYPFFSKLAAHGDVFPLTSVFPSTTPAALTTLHTGLTPQEHGLPEWTVFFEEVGAVIETLPFRKLLTPGRDTLLELGGTSEMLYHGRTIYQVLKAADVPAHVFTYYDYASSAYSAATQNGARVVPYKNLGDMVTSLRTMLEAPENWGYFFVYWGAIDSAMHQYAPYSSQHEIAVRELADAFEREALEKLPKSAMDETLFMMTADHGHVTVDHRRMIYLDKLPAMETAYAKSKAGLLIPPTGAPQDVFLFVPDHNVDSTIALLEKELGHNACVMKMKKAIDLGLFGMGRPSDRFLRRTGTILVLPRRGNHVWYRFQGREFDQRGCHGGLSAEEMIVPFAIAEMSDLI